MTFIITVVDQIHVNSMKMDLQYVLMVLDASQKYGLGDVEMYRFRHTINVTVEQRSLQKEIMVQAIRKISFVVHSPHQACVTLLQKEMESAMVQSNQDIDMINLVVSQAFVGAEIGLPVNLKISVLLKITKSAMENLSVKIYLMWNFATSILMMHAELIPSTSVQTAVHQNIKIVTVQTLT